MKEPTVCRLVLHIHSRFTKKKLTKKTNQKEIFANIYIRRNETKEMASLGDHS